MNKDMMPQKKATVWIVFCAVAVVLIILDLLLKHWAEANLMGQPSRVLINGILGLTYHENPGVAFGLLSDFGWGRWVITVINIFLMLGLLWYYHQMSSGKKFWFVRVPLILIFAGGVGNLIDRIALGIVRDMLEFLFVRFAIFNLADVYVTVGAFSFLFFALFVVKDIPYIK